MAEFPNLWPASVEIERLAAQRVGRDPFAFGQEQGDDAGRAFRIVIRMQPMVARDAAVMLAFLDGLDGMNGTFNFNLSPWWRGAAPAPGIREFRLLPGQGGWDSDLRVLWHVGIEAMEEP